MTTDEQKLKKCEQIHVLCNMLVAMGYGKLRFAPVSKENKKEGNKNEG